MDEIHKDLLRLLGGRTFVAAVRQRVQARFRQWTSRRICHRDISFRHFKPFGLESGLPIFLFIRWPPPVDFIHFFCAAATTEDKLPHWRDCRWLVGLAAIMAVGAVDFLLRFVLSSI